MENTSLYPSLPNYQSFRNFEEAAAETLAFLRQKYGFGLWMITRTIQDDWIVLKANDKTYGVNDGEVFRWSDSFCYQMIRDKGPHIAPQSDLVDSYARTPIRQAFQIKSYVGFPLVAGDGSLFGTLCAIDPEPKPEEIQADEALFVILAKYLSLALNDELKSTELKDRIAKLEDVAFHDKLTCLLNRHAWDTLLEQQETKCRTLGEPAAVIVVDLDGLKQINDTQGHSAGDAHILSAAQALKNAGRPNDVVARLGGDEFGLLVEGAIAIDPSPLLQRIKLNLSKASVKASIGWARRDSKRGLQYAFDVADKEMYEDKTRRKHCQSD